MAVERSKKVVDLLGWRGEGEIVGRRVIEKESRKFGNFG